MSEVKLNKCLFCGNYPRLLKVKNEYKYMCCFDNPQGKCGYWHRTKNGAKRAWNKRADGSTYA